MDLEVEALQARVQPGPVCRRQLGVERAGDEDDQHREERRDDPEHRHDPGRQLPARFPVEDDRGGAVRGQDQ